MFPPKVDFNSNDSNYQSIIERMARAKWISGTAISTPNEMAAILTSVGVQRMTEAVAVLDELFPDIIRTPHEVKPLIERPLEALAKVLDCRNRLLRIASDLQEPPMTAGEMETLFALMAVTAHNHSKGDSPPDAAR